MASARPMAGGTRSTARRPATKLGAPAPAANSAQAPQLRLEFREGARAADPSRTPHGSAGAGLLSAREIVERATSMLFDPHPLSSVNAPPLPQRHLSLLRNPTRQAAEAIHAGDPGGGDSDSSTSSSSPPSAFFVVRALDVDRRGRCLVGVESGPHATLRDAVALLHVVPHYGPCGMADELILLARDVIVYRDDAEASRAHDGGARFIISSKDRVASIRKNGAWEVDLATVRRTEKEQQEGAILEAEKAAAEALASAAGALLEEKEQSRDSREKEKTTTTPSRSPPTNAGVEETNVARERRLDGPGEARGDGGDAGAANDDRNANGARGDDRLRGRGSGSDRASKRVKTNAVEPTDEPGPPAGPGPETPRARRRATPASTSEPASSSSTIPFVSAEILGGDPAVVPTPPTLEAYHNLRGQVMGGVEKSQNSPSLPPPPKSHAQFQLATEKHPYHVLAIRCGERCDPGDFSIRLNDRGYAYVKAAPRDAIAAKAAEERGEPWEAAGMKEGFELVTQFPGLVDELSTQSVFKDGVLFVVAAPRTANVVAVTVAAEDDE